MISPRPTVLGLEVNPGTRQELLQTMQQHLADGEGLLHVVTANPEYVMTARKDESFADAVNSAGLVTVDGAGLAIALRMIHPGVESGRYTGVMLTPDMAKLSSTSGVGVFLLGAGPGVADAAADLLRTKFPGANIVGTWADGSPRPEHDEETIRRIRDSGATIVLVAYGAPAQIYWIQRNSQSLENVGVKIVSGIGGALDYISGTTPLAPAFLRKIGLEWLYRLVREPWRWRRQLVLPHFALLVILEFLKSRRRGGVE